MGLNSHFINTDDSSHMNLVRLTPYCSFLFIFLINSSCDLCMVSFFKHKNFFVTIL